MTKQIDDVLIFEGEIYLLRGCPLESYWEKLPPKPTFQVLGSRCWRGYRATWRVVDGRLYLSSIGTGTDSSKDDETGHTTIRMFMHEALPDIFPVVPHPVFAVWVSGEFYIETASKDSPKLAKMLVINGGVIGSATYREAFDPWAERMKTMPAYLRGDSVS
jgi:hypothetical protein